MTKYKTMNKFLREILYFTFPILIIVSLPIYVLYLSGESFRNLKDVKDENPELVGYLYHDRNYKVLKYELFKKSEPSIISLGSSRALQFRSEFFDEKFYNMGYVIKRMKDLEEFTSFYRDNNMNVKTVLLTVDFWMFNEQWDEFYPKENPLDLTENSANELKYIPSTFLLRNIWRDIFKGVYPLNQKFQTNYFGLNAQIYNNGFRRDGSYQYGTQVSKLLGDDKTAGDYKNHTTLDFIKNGKGRFACSMEISESALTQLKTALDFFDNQGIEIYLLLPPYAPEVYRTLTNEKQSCYSYQDKVIRALEEIDYSYSNVSFYNFSLFNKEKFNQNYYIDGYHGGEVLYYEMLKFISKSDINNVIKLKNIEHLNSLELKL